jgi:hypothetical protein
LRWNRNRNQNQCVAYCYRHRTGFARQARAVYRERSLDRNAGSLNTDMPCVRITWCPSWTRQCALLVVLFTMRSKHDRGSGSVTGNPSVNVKVSWRALPDSLVRFIPDAVFHTPMWLSSSSIRRPLGVAHPRFFHGQEGGHPVSDYCFRRIETPVPAAKQ